LGWSFFLAAPIALKAQLNRGTLEGIVTDPQGAAVPGVAVTVTEVAINVTAKTVTNRSGSYLVEALVPGEHSSALRRLK
jgi:protocatechuate 3,4-dioxygenase beta subunit